MDTEKWHVEVKEPLMWTNAMNFLILARVNVYDFIPFDNSLLRIIPVEGWLINALKKYDDYMNGMYGITWWGYPIRFPIM